MRVVSKHGCSGAAATIIILLLAMAMGAAAACGGLGGTDTTAAPDTTLAPTTSALAETTTSSVGSSTTMAASTTTGPPETTVTTEELSSAETVLPDGSIRAMGYITEVSEGGERRLKIDFAEMLTGEEARQAAVDAGELGPGEDLPNDYFISNVNPEIREFVVSGSVAITTAIRSGGPDEPATWAEFKSWFGGAPPVGTEYLRDTPWWIVREAGTDMVINIDQQYVP